MTRLLPFLWLALAGGPAAEAATGDALQRVPQPWHGSAQAAAVPLAGHWSVLAQDVTISRTLERWAAQAGMRLKWDAQRNFLVGAPDVIDGSFETALQALLGSAGIRESDYPLEACIYANTPPLVRITRQGEQSRECEAP